METDWKDFVKHLQPLERKELHQQLHDSFDHVDGRADVKDELERLDQKILGLNQTIEDLQTKPCNLTVREVHNLCHEFENLNSKEIREISKHRSSAASTWKIAFRSSLKYIKEMHKLTHKLLGIEK